MERDRCWKALCGHLDPAVPEVKLSWTCQIHKPVSFSLFLQPVGWVLSLPHRQSLDWDAPFVNCTVQLLLSILFSSRSKFNVKKRQRIFMLPHWNFCCWPPSLVSWELQTFGWGKVHHCWSGILQSMYFFMHAFIIFSASCYPFTFFLQKKKIEHVITSFSHLPSYSGIWQSWIGYSWTVELKTSQTIPPSKTTKNYFATEGPRFLNAFQSKDTNARMRSDAIGCWLRAMWRTSSPSGHPPPTQLSGLPTWSPQVPEMIRAVQMSQGSCKPWAWPQPLSAPLFSCHSWLGHWPNHGPLWRASQTRPTFPHSQAPDVPAIALYCQTGSNNLSEVTAFTVISLSFFFFLILFFSCDQIT